MWPAQPSKKNTVQAKSPACTNPGLHSIIMDFTLDLNGFGQAFFMDIIQ